MKQFTLQMNKAYQRPIVELKTWYGFEALYAELKKEYQTLKALLNFSGVNLTEIDEIKKSKSKINRSK